MYELVTPNSIAMSQEDEESNEKTARRLVKGKGEYHAYLFRRVPDEWGNVTLRIVAEYIGFDGSLQTVAEQ